MQAFEWLEQMRLGNLLLDEFPKQAVAHFQRALELMPELPAAQMALGQALLAIGDAQAALPHFVALAADSAAGPEVDYYKALTYKALQDPSAAIGTLEWLLRKHPHFAAAQRELGRLALQAGDSARAAASFKRYLQLQPGDVEVMIELERLLERLGAREEAAELCLAIFRLDSTRSEMLMRGMELKVQEDPRMLVHLLIQIAIEAPEFRSQAALQMAAVTEYMLDDEERQRCLEMALEDPHLPDRAAWLMRAGLVLPALPMSQAELQQAYAQFDIQLGAFEKELPPGAGVLPDYSNLMPYLALNTPFGMLPCHNVDPLSWRRRWGALLQRLLPARSFSPVPGSGGLRIGFVYNQNSAIQAFLFDLLRHWPAELAQPVQVVIFISWVTQADLAPLRADFEQYLLPSAPAEALALLENSRLDLLFLTEVYTDQLLQTLLACYRVAPVQVTSWLSSGTSGLPNLDYFISSKLLESADHPQRFYSEKLILLDEIPSYLPLRTLRDQAPTRADYGLPEGPLYLCPHTLYKIHLDFETILAEILTQDPAGQLVLITHPDNPYLRDKLLARLEQHFPQLMPRIWFLPKLSHQEYLGLLTLGDVMLDPIYFGGGTTSFEAIGLGVPIVTWPGERLHGRITHGYYAAIDVLDCVASSPQAYVRLAIELAHDQELNASIRARLLAARNLLFERAPAVRELADCLVELAEEGRRVAGRETRGAGKDGEQEKN